MARSKKLVTIRKPRVRVGSKGIRITKPTARIGGKVGLNVSSRGISASARTPFGTFSTRGSGFTRRRRKTGCSALMLAAAIALLVSAAILCSAPRRRPESSVTIACTRPLPTDSLAS